MRCLMWRNCHRRSWMPCDGTTVNWLYKPGKTSSMVSLIPEARKYNIHNDSRPHALGSHQGCWHITISRGPAMAMTTPVRVVVFVFLIIFLRCSFVVCSEIPIA